MINQLPVFFFTVRSSLNWFVYVLFFALFTLLTSSFAQIQASSILEGFCLFDRNECKLPFEVQWVLFKLVTMNMNMNIDIDMCYVEIAMCMHSQLSFYFI
jgi:hypothetical protein